MSGLLQSALYLPVPLITATAPEPASKDSRLQTILANLDAQHGQVRANLVAAAQAELHRQHAAAAAAPFSSPSTSHNSINPASGANATHAGIATSEDAMDLDLPDRDASPRHPQQQQEQQQFPDHDRLLANLQAPYLESSGDPCISPDATINPNVHTAMTAPESVSSAEVRVMRQAIEQLERYEQHVRQTRGFYVQALERQRRMREDGTGEAATTTTTTTATAAVPAVAAAAANLMTSSNPLPPPPPSTTTTTTTMTTTNMTASSSSSIGNIDVSRDPRRRR